MWSPAGFRPRRIWEWNVAEDYSGKKAAEIVGISYRQLDYWARTDLVRPSVTDASGSGSRRRYSYRDLLELKVVKTLLDNGIKLESVRQAFTYLRDQLGEDVASAQLIISGGSAILVRDDNELIDVLKQGQTVMTSVLSLGTVQREVDDAIVHLFPSPSPSSQLDPVAAPDSTTTKAPKSASGA
ncbi:MAG: MerR family transcriptional regulator [Microthrixaceae bacterium]|nr:MerR family transcriptional regulator [Microthrixaceae bacterium]